MNQGRHALPWWLRSRFMPWAGGLVALLIMAMATAFMFFERSTVETTHLARVELLARILEDQTSLTMGSADIALRALAETLEDEDFLTAGGRTPALLRESFSRLPFLRSVSIMSRDRMVLVSSGESNLGQVVAAGLLPEPVDRQPLLGSLVGGRDLPDARPIDTAAPYPNFLPLVRRLHTRTAGDFFLVATINLDYFANQYQLTLGQDNLRAALSSFDGRLLVGTEGLASPPGTSVAATRIFSSFLPETEQGAYIGSGMAQDKVLTAFRTLRRLPLVMAVERPYLTVDEELARLARWVWSLAGVLLALVAAAALTARRSLRRHEALAMTLHHAEIENGAMLSRYQRLATDLERQKLALDEHAVVSITNPAGVIEYANDRLARISGYTQQELIGSEHRMLKSGEQPDEFYAQMWEQITRGEVWHGELINRRRDGRLYWVASTIVPVPGDDGKPRQFISIQTDISALRIAERDLSHARDNELQIGARIQQSLLVTPPPYQSPGVWMTSFNQASQGIDGDFVEVIRTGERFIDVITGDVMGKGLPAALMGAATKLQISRSIAELMAQPGRGGVLPSPAQVVAAVHRAMTPNLQALEAFVTLCYLRLDLQLDTLTWVGCGHEEPMLLRRGQPIVMLANQHPPLGVLDDADYEQSEIWLAPDDALFLYSDGVTDATRVDGERVGRVRLGDQVIELAALHETPAALLHSLRRTLLHTGVQLNDDVTMALVRRIDLSGRLQRQEVPAELSAIRPMRAFVTAHAAQAGLDDDSVGLLEVAVVEVFTNIVRHGKGLLPGAPIEVITRATDGGFEIDMVHLGEFYQPPDELVEANFDEYPEGGFGLAIIRGVFDRVEYLHSDGVNTIRMVKSVTVMA